MRSILLAFCLFSAPAFATSEAPEPTLQTGQDAAALRAELSHKRADLITELRRYAEAGNFPVNDFQTGLANQFMDDEGNLCAMAYLIVSTGNYPLVAATWHSNNGLRFEGLTDGPVYDWVLSSGLLLEEAAMVQVPEMEIMPIHSEALMPLEVERQRSHLLAVATSLELTTERSLDEAVQRLGGGEVVAVVSSTGTPAL